MWLYSRLPLKMLGSLYLDLSIWDVNSLMSTVMEADAVLQDPTLPPHHLFNRWVVSNSLRPHGLQHARLLCPSLSPGVCSSSSPLSRSLLWIKSMSGICFKSSVLMFNAELGNILCGHLTSCVAAFPRVPSCFSFPLALSSLQKFCFCFLHIRSLPV